MISVAKYSSCGGREYNEDTCDVKNMNKKICAMVADGLGGHGGGKTASSTAVTTILGDFMQKDIGEKITENDIILWFNHANDIVIEQQTKQCEMKTTMALLCFEHGSNLFWAAHLGDTRIYHFENGKVKYISFDHSVSRMSVLAGEISMEEIRFHSDRNKLLKAIGRSDEVMPEIKCLEIDRTQNNAFLLCTDGFWEYVTEEQMELLLAESESAKQWLQKMRQLVVDNAKEHNDNHTAVAIFL